MFSQKDEEISLETETRRLCVTLPAELLEQVDKIAWRDFCKRSDVTRIALIEYIRAHSDAGVPTAPKKVPEEAPSKLEPAGGVDDQGRPLVSRGYDSDGQWHDFELEWLLRGAGSAYGPAHGPAHGPAA